MRQRSHSRSGPPPGQPGTRIHYFMTKPRHRTVVPAVIVSSAAIALAGWYMWSVTRGTAMWMLSVSVLLSLGCVALWYSGERRTAALNRMADIDVVATPVDTARQSPNRPHDGN